MYNYQAFGLTIQSEFKCPFLMTVKVDETAPDIYIRCGQVPPTFQKDALNRSRYQIQNSKIIISFQDVARFLIEDGSLITVDACTQDHAYISLFLLGPVISALLVQRNCFIVRATSMTLGENAILFCSNESDNSEIITTFINHGYKLLSDNFSVLELQDDKAMVYSGYPLLKLSHSSLISFKADKNQFKAIGHRTNKYYVPIGQYFYEKPLLLAQIILLNKSENEMQSELLSGSTRLTSLLNMSPHLIFVTLLHRHEFNFINYAKLMRQALTIRRIYYTSQTSFIHKI
jgi:hypothetical protein